MKHLQWAQICAANYHYARHSWTTSSAPWWSWTYIRSSCTPARPT